jgi:hypothetical protein
MLQAVINKTKQISQIIIHKEDRGLSLLAVLGLKQLFPAII